MRPVPAGAFLTNELLWSEFLLDASQCWGNRLRKKFWDSMLGPVKDDIVIGRQIKASASTVHHIDPSSVQDSSAENMARMVGSGTNTVSLEESRKLRHAEQLDVALHTMSDLQRAGVCISRESDKKDIWAGRRLYSLVASTGLDSIACLGDHLICLFALCGNLPEANQMSDKISKPTSYSWNAITSANTKLGNSERAIELYQKMLDEGVCPDESTLMGTTKACGAVGAIKQSRVIHEEIIKCGLESEDFLCSTVFEMYAKCGSPEEGRKLFDKLACSNSVLWNAMIAGCAQHGNGSLAIELFEKMQQESIIPNKITFSTLLKACGHMQGLEKGMPFHNLVVASGLNSDVTIGSTLVDMYAKCGSLEEGRKIFDALPGQSGNAMTTGYAQHNKDLLALELYKKKLQQGLKADTATYSAILKVCTSLEAITQGRCVHKQIAKSALEADAIIGNILIDMYAKCGSLEEAHSVFDNLSNRNVVSWSAISAGHAQIGNGHLAQDRIQDVGIRTGLEAGTSFWSTLVDMYVKCGSLVDADVLRRLKNRTAVLWNALIVGYTQQGNCRMVSKCFKGMQQEALKPDDTTYTSILAACSHGGHVEGGRHHFKSMIKPSPKHFNGMVNLLGSAGRMNEAREVLRTLPISANATFWRSLTTSSEKYGNEEVGEQSSNEAVQSAPDNAASYVLMSNIYADGDKWADVRRINDMRIKARAWKKPGRAYVEIKSRVHEFVVGDQTHQESTHIYDKLRKLKRQMNHVGYVPNVDLILENRSFSDPFKPK